MVLAVGLLGCLKTEFESRELTPGRADFYNYIAIGNSLTQGFQDSESVPPCNRQWFNSDFCSLLGTSDLRPKQI